MQNFLTLSNGRKLVLNTPEEEAQINAGIAADPDTHEMTEAEFKQLRPARGRPALANKKMMLSLRVEPQVLAALRATGDGWQTRAAAVLKDAVENGRV